MTSDDPLDGALGIEIARKLSIRLCQARNFFVRETEMRHLLAITQVQSNTNSGPQAKAICPEKRLLGGSINDKIFV